MGKRWKSRSSREVACWVLRRGRDRLKTQPRDHLQDTGTSGVSQAAVSRFTGTHWEVLSLHAAPAAHPHRAPLWPCISWFDTWWSFEGIEVKQLTAYQLKTDVSCFSTLSSVRGEKEKRPCAFALLCTSTAVEMNLDTGMSPCSIVYHHLHTQLA